jgi:hypothetical protein
MGVRGSGKMFKCVRKLRSGCERQLINFYVCEEAEQKA